MNPTNQNSSMIGNDGNDPEVPLGQSSGMLDININSGGNDNQQGSGEEQDANNDQLVKKRRHYLRHDQHQIQELENFFKEFPYPNAEQRKDLSRRLGLEPVQIRFWFQNKRNQMKKKGERNDNSSFRAENDKSLEAFNNGCPHWDGPRALDNGEMPYVEHPLKLDNFQEVNGISVAAMEELLQMAQMEEPLWLPSVDGETVYLNEEEYMSRFLKGRVPKPQGIKTEASRENAVVTINQMNLVKFFMDVNYWSSLFSGIVSTARTLDVMSTGVAGDLNGAMQLVYAEFQVPSPQVPVRDCYFVRYCRQTVEGIWAIVDVSLDHTPATRCRKRPSGCLIQEMPNGYSKVTWIEHVDVDDIAMYNIYKPIVDSGLAFGAKRWIATLDRQCERLASAMATNLPHNDIRHMLLIDQEGRRGVLKLAERMVISCCSGMSSSTAHQWTTLMGSGYGINDVRIMARRCINDLGRPHGILLSGSTCLWLPISPKIVFDFLRDINTRSKWDILSNGGDIQELAHIANGREPSNCVSVLRVLNSQILAQNNMLILQETVADPTGAFIVYAPADVRSVNIILCGGNPDNVELLPSGFAILPDGRSGSTAGTVAGSGGTLLTVAFQVLVESVPTAMLSVQSVTNISNLVSCTIDNMKTALLSILLD